MTHPSFLHLDRHALGVQRPAVTAHLTECERCSAHVARVSQPAPVPRTLEEAVRPPPLTSRLRWRWLVPVASLATLATVMLLVLPDKEAVRTKGTPALAVFVRHAEQVVRWDGKTPLMPGDAFRLEVAPAGFSYVTVVQRAGPEPTVLYAAAVPAEGTVLLEPSWTLDAAPGPERVTVVFSQALLSAPELAGLPEVTRSRSVWSFSLVLPKELQP